MRNNTNIKQQRKESRARKILYEFFAFSPDIDSDLRSLIITRVHIAKDGRSGILFFVKDKETQDDLWIKHVVERFNAVRSEMQSWLSKNMELKFVPKLTFKFDNDYFNFVRVENIIDELGKDV